MPAVKLMSMNGGEICPAVNLHADTALRMLETCAIQALGVKRCRLLSPSGVEVDTAVSFGASGLDDGDTVMVVALFDPLDKYHPFILPENLLACLPHALAEFGHAPCVAAFEQYSADGLLQPEALAAALGTMMSTCEAERLVATWSRRDGWEQAPLSLTDFVSLMHGSRPLIPGDIAWLHSKFTFHDDRSDGTVAASKFLNTDLWILAANGPNILPSFEAEGKRTNLNAEMLPGSLRPWDTSDDARMTFEQFLSLSVLKKLWTYRDGEADISECFRVFDLDGNGFISAADLRHVLFNLGENVPEGELDEVMREAGVTDDGMINYEEFTKLMMAR